MKKFGRKFLGISALALSLLVSVPANAEELTNTEQPMEEIVVDMETPDDTEDVAMATNGWVSNEYGQWLYYVDGVSVKNKAMKIGDTYYCFDYDGSMLNGVGKSVYDPETGSYYYYIARKGGALYSGEWYGNAYYAVGGRRASGPTEINGRLYYFNSYGQLMTSGQVTIDGVVYECNSAGVLSEYKDTKWINKNGRWMYRQDGELVKNQVVNIGGKLYAFNSSGYMYDYGEFSLNSESYYATPDGSLHTGWYYDWRGTHYFLEDGTEAKSEKLTIDGEIYYFDGYGLLSFDGGCWGGSIDGKESIYNIRLTDGSEVDISGPGWHQVEGYWYHIDKNGILAEYCTREIGGKIYGFGYDGRLLEGGLFDGGSAGYFRTREDGTVYTNTWYSETESIDSQWGSGVSETPMWRYYGSDGRSAGGLVTIDGKTYLFRHDNHILVQDNFYYYDGVAYKADRNGVGKVIGDGWHQGGDGKWVYILNGKYIGDGLHEIDGKTYYFEYGRLVDKTGPYYCGSYTDGGDYIINENGEVINTPGWYKLGDDWYYINDNGEYHTGLRRVNGYLYYLEPELVCNKNYLCYGNALYEETLYKVNGSMGNLTPVTTDGIYITEENSYCISDGKLYKGWKKENGVWYYFNPEQVVSDYIEDTYGDYYVFDAKGRLITNTWLVHPYYRQLSYAKSSGALAVGTYTIDGVEYDFDEDGLLITDDESVSKIIDYTYYKNDGTKAIANFKNGWNKLQGKYFYVTNGYLMKGGSYVVDGKLYYFDYNGEMATDKKNGSYIFGKDGAAITGWVQWGGDWYYCDPSTYLIATGWRTIGKYEYYFEESRYSERIGIMCTSEKIIDGKKYVFNTNGTVKRVDDKVYNGWVNVNGTPTYFKNGQLYTGWYGDYFLQFGVKQYNKVVTWNGVNYYVGADGKYLRSQWTPYTTLKNQYKKYFTKSGGAIAKNEWIIIGGYWYYFDDNSLRVTGMQEIDGVTYYFDETGKMKGTYKTLTEGWNKVDGHWFYVINNEVLMDGKQYIKGKWYGFSNGIMIQNDFSNNPVEDYYDDYNKDYNFYYDANGVRTTYVGWQKINGKWYYFDKESRQTRGWMVLDGKTYYLNPEMLTGYHYLNNYACYFDENGVLQSRKAFDDGWNRFGGKWYYYIDKYTRSNYMAMIDGDYYYFDMYGKMVTNSLVEYNRKMYFFGSDGKLVRKAGIYKDAQGGSVYVTSDGIAHIGDTYINGVLKFMNAVCGIRKNTSNYY